MDFNSGGILSNSESPAHWILDTPPKPAPSKRTLNSHLNCQEIPDLNSLLNVPVVLLNPLPEKSASCSANNIMAPPFAPITPDKVNIVHHCEPREAVHQVSEGLNKKRRVEFDMLHTVEIEEQTDLCPNNSLRTPNKYKKAQACQTDEEENIEENLMNNIVSFEHAESSSEEEDEDKGKQGTRTPQKKVPKRKKHRPKVVLEDKPKKTPKPATPKTAENKEKPLTEKTYVRRKKSLNSLETPSDMGNENKERLTPKRTYVRKKRALKSLEDPSNEVEKKETKSTSGNEKGVDCLQTPSSTIGETINLPSSSAIEKPVKQLPSNDTKSARRCLNFSAEAQAANGDWETVNGTDTGYNKELALELTEGLELFVSELPARIKYDAYALNRATSKFLNEYLNLPESNTPYSQSSEIKTVDKHLEGSNRKENAENGISMQNDEEKLVSDSQVDAVLVDENIEKPGTKRDANDTEQHSGDILFPHGYKEADENNLSHDLIQFIPVIYKKRRTERGQILGCKRAVVRKVKYHTFGDEDNSKELDELQQSELVLALVPDMRTTKKRSKVPTRARKLSFTTIMDDCSHLLWSPERIRASLDISEYKKYGPEACMEALSADTRFKITKKPRNKEYFDLVSSLGQSLVVELPASQAGQWKNLNNLEVGSIEDIHSRRFNIRGSLYSSFQSQEIVSYMDPVDIIVQKMKHLQINEGHATVTKAYSSIVPYGGGGMMVPYGSIYHLIKKQRPRAKVDLDPETNRVWNLLMGKKSTDKDDEEDMDKEKWWEEERRVFRGRAESFVARMHLILGDRRFSKWKGSVVDSVVGVFLTQNVSDHLSSSAFMSLAANFPLRSESSTREASAENMNKSTEQGDDSIFASSYNSNWQEDISIPASTDADFIGINENEREANEATKALRSDDTNETEHSEGNDLLLHGIEKRTNFGPVQKMDILTTTETICFEDLEDRISSQKSSSERSPGCLNRTTSHVGLDSSSVTILEDLALKLSRDSDSSISSVERMENIGVVGEGTESCVPLINSEQNKTCDMKATEGSNSYAGWLTLSSNSTATTTVESHVSESKFSVQMSTCSETEICLPHDKIEESLEENTFRECPQERNEHAVEVPNAGGADFEAENTYKRIEIQTAAQYCRESEKCMFSCNDFEEGVESSETTESNLKGEACCSQNDQPEKEMDTSEAKKVNVERERKNLSEWESLQNEAFANGAKSERSSETMDSVDWEAVRTADVTEIASIIRERGMNNVLAQRIKDFLNRLLNDHGSIDLEWLRDVQPDKAKEYLLSIRGLGIKSVECVRLLTLHHLAFPVDTNVGRIAVRLGWVPLQPLPESLQLHLLELYPMIEHIQKYLWPRLCTLDQRMLYELHYQMITFGKVFCTKTKPNCNACPMRGECKHFASAFASARLALPGPEERRIVKSGFPSVLENDRNLGFSSLPQPQLEGGQPAQESIGNHCEPIIEEPATPEHESVQTLENEIEDAFYEDPDGIPTIKLSLEEFKENLKSYMQENNMEIEEGDMSNALVAITAGAASIPMPKLKNVNRLRTEHQVYELPDSHPLLEGVDRRVLDDPCPYLLAIWTPGETAQSTEQPQSCCNSQDSATLCERRTCFACNSVREAQAQTVRGTLLIPCRTAMRGSFPLNGTYFQVNEVFADHNSSCTPIYVPRNWIWNLSRRTVYFGTSVTSIFRGLTTEDIQQCFWRGFVCVRGFDQTSRAPRPLYARLHFSPSMAVRNRRGSADDETNQRASR